MAAQIKLYSIVHGKRKGLASCTSDPIIFVLLHSNMWWGPLRPRGSRTCSPWWEWMWPPRWRPPFEPENSKVRQIVESQWRSSFDRVYLVCGRFWGSCSPDCRTWGSRVSFPARERSAKLTDSCRSCASVRNVRRRDDDKPSFARIRGNLIRLIITIILPLKSNIQFYSLFIYLYQRVFQLNAIVSVLIIYITWYGCF